MRHKRIIIILQQYGFLLILITLLIFVLTLLLNDLPGMGRFCRYPVLEVYLPIIFGWVHNLVRTILLGISFVGGAQILVLLKQKRVKKGENGRFF